MKIGFSLSNNQGIEDVREVLDLATRAEELGFDSVWASEHIFNVSYVQERIGNRPYYEPLTILSYVAATTNTIGLGTSVLVLPYHNPIRLAKTAATLDVVSGGRLTLGVGVGVIEEELAAMGSPFSERGAITDETIAIMKELWTKEEAARYIWNFWLLEVRAQHGSGLVLGAAVDGPILVLQLWEGGGRGVLRLEAARGVGAAEEESRSGEAAGERGGGGEGGRVGAGSVAKNNGGCCAL